MFSWPILSFYKWGNGNPKRLNVSLSHTPLCEAYMLSLMASELAIGKSVKIIKAFPSLSILFLTLSDFLPARLQIFSAFLSSSHQSQSKLWSLTFMLAVYLFPLLPSIELFAWTNCKLWNCGVKNWH